jgi:hypothetical protein
MPFVVAGAMHTWPARTCWLPPVDATTDATAAKSATTAAAVATTITSADDVGGMCATDCQLKVPVLLSPSSSFSGHQSDRMSAEVPLVDLSRRLVRTRRALDGDVNTSANGAVRDGDGDGGGDDDKDGNSRNDDTFAAKRRRSSHGDGDDCDDGVCKDVGGAAAHNLYVCQVPICVEKDERDENDDELGDGPLAHLFNDICVPSCIPRESLVSVNLWACTSASVTRFVVQRHVTRSFRVAPFRVASYM